MTTPSLWSKVAIAVQSALATAITITGITKASPGVVSFTGSDPTNGSYVILSVQGMHQVDQRVFRTANLSAGVSFELEGEDTSNYDTFTSGTAQVITFGTSLGIVRNLSASGGDFSFEDTTTIHDDVNKQIPGNASALTYNWECIWDSSDAGFIALKAASDNKAQRAIRITFANGQKSLVSGYVGASGIPGGSAPGLVTTPVVFTAFGRPTHYAT